MILLLVDDSLPYPTFALPRLALAQSATLLLRPCFSWLGTRLAVGENLSTGHSRFLHFRFFETSLSDTNTVTNSRHDGMGSTILYSTSLRSDPLAWYCLSSRWHLTALYHQEFDHDPLLLPLGGWYCTVSFLCLEWAIYWAVILKSGALGINLLQPPVKALLLVVIYLGCLIFVLRLCHGFS